MADAQYEQFNYESETQKRVHEKLHRVFEKSAGSMSVKMLAYAEAAWNLPRTTTPSLVEITITSDDMALARETGDIGFNQFIGAKSDLVRNLSGLREAMVLKPDEAEYCTEQQRVRLTYPLRMTASVTVPPLRGM